MSLLAQIDTHAATFALKSSTSSAHLPGYVDNTSQIGTFALTSGPSGVSEDTTDNRAQRTVNTAQDGRGEGVNDDALHHVRF